jgi:hypothetical protein
VKRAKDKRFVVRWLGWTLRGERTKRTGREWLWSATHGRLTHGWYSTSGVASSDRQARERALAKAKFLRRYHREFRARDRW